MLCHETEHRLKNFLIAVGDGERGLEACRQRLCNIRIFAPHSAFQRIDRDATGRVRSHDLLHFLREHHNHQATENECYHLVRFFDSDNDGSLSFQE
jgi:Ca2+-binding EF-hand superfamily protein